MIKYFVDYVYALNLYKEGTISKKDDFYFEPYSFPSIKTNNATRSFAAPLYRILEKDPDFRFTEDHYKEYNNKTWRRLIEQQIYDKPRGKKRRRKRFRFSEHPKGTTSITKKTTEKIQYLFDQNCLWDIAKEHHFETALDLQKIENMWEKKKEDKNQIKYDHLELSTTDEETSEN